MLRKGGAPKSWRDEFTKLRDGELHASPTPPIYTQSSVAPATAAAWRVPPTQPRISHPSPRPSNLQPSSRIPPSQPTSVGEMATFPQDIPSIQIDHRLLNMSSYGLTTTQLFKLCEDEGII